MKTAIGATLTILSLTIPAVAATTDKYQFKGLSAYASFYKYDGCNSSYLDVSIYDNITKDAPGAPTSQQQAYIYYSNFNSCTGTGSYGYGYVTNPTFTISNSLQSASLNATIPVTEYTYYNYESGTTKTATVAVNWTGTGDTYRGNSHSHYQGPGYISNYRYNGSYRDAEATGSITIDGGTNLLTDLSSNYASLNSSNSGSRTITKN